jgi:hypothetical protein
MRSVLMLAAFAVTISASSARAQAMSSAAGLFAALEGRWDCSGGFPDGRKLVADLSFTREREGRLLRFSHVDRAPGSYWQDATWMHDSKGQRVLSLSTSGSTKNLGVGAALFVAHSWTDSSIVLEADSLKGPPWSVNRFSYSLRAPSTLLKRWEVQRNGSWVLGDSLVCGRKQE